MAKRLSQETPPGKRRSAGVAGSTPLFPRADGVVWNPRLPLDPGDQWRSRFLDAYFLINLAYARLVALRRGQDRRVPNRLKEAVLKAIEQAIADREKLEDQAAPYGFLAVPVYEGGFAIDIRFSDVQTARAASCRLVTSSSSILLKFRVPLPLSATSCKT